MALLPETHLLPCTGCAELLRVAEPVCPHCGVARARAERTGPLVALAAALAMAACGTPQPEYGVPDTESDGSLTDATTTEATDPTSDATTTDATGTDATGTDATGTDATGTTAPTTGTDSTATTDATTG
ncbi:hypothetical protein [Nannocystis punicea]|uniref:Uncharacterized protein n=1 Tax=Nannocystis punicea TaxID=2995304 RepID=A0ABY7GRX3_9BACT|nr:hypothetical protein [Nannocystis poenicansa]WAS89678.1 hypothetical protein O0S08_26085 [Nannocystis poenicansa]